MLIQESHVDVPTTADGQGTMRKCTALTAEIPLTIHIQDMSMSMSNHRTSTSTSLLSYQGNLMLIIIQESTSTTRQSRDTPMPGSRA
jgi:hypothetical protein